jgi:hypothetical protein
MTNVRISDKGKALLKKRASSKVAIAIVRQGDSLSKNGIISIDVDGKTIKVRERSVSSS